MKKCLQCGQKYSDEKKYCLRCGIALDKDNRQEGLKCNQCGTENNPDFKFCKKCGIQLIGIEEKTTVQKQQIKIESLISEEKSMQAPEPVTSEDKKPILSNEIKEQVKIAAKEAFKKAGVVSREAAMDQNKFNSAIDIAYKLIPAHVRLFVKKDTFNNLMGEIRDQLFQTQTDKIDQKSVDVITPLETSKQEDGHEIFTQCLKLIAAHKSTPENRIDLLNKALLLGLPLKDEIKAYAFLGIEMVGLEKYDEAIKHHDHALELAKNYKEIFNDKGFVILGRSICAAYQLKAREIKGENGVDQSISYMLEKENILKQLCSPGFYLELGNLFDEKQPKDFDKVRYYYNKAINSETLDDTDTNEILMAKNNLSILEKEIEALRLKEVPKPVVVSETRVKPEIVVQPKIKEQGIPKDKVSEESVKKPSKLWIWITVFGLVLIVAGVGGYRYFSGPTSKKPIEATISPQHPQALPKVEPEIEKPIPLAPKNEVVTPSIPKPETPSVDITKIERDINTTLRNKNISNVYAEVNTDLVATLTGTVQSQDERNKAINIARSYREIKQVRDNIQMKEVVTASPQPPPRIDPAVIEGEMNRAIRNAGLEGITVAVNNDLQVTLKGTVRSTEEKNRAFEIAKTFKDKGVKKIKDIIFIVE